MPLAALLSVAEHACETMNLEQNFSAGIPGPANENHAGVRLKSQRAARKTEH